MLPNTRRLTPLPGAVCAQRRRRRTFYYRFWREGGKLKKEYIRRTRVPYVKRQCALYREQRDWARRVLQAAIADWRQARDELREAERDIDAKRGR